MSLSFSSSLSLSPPKTFANFIQDSLFTLSKPVAGGELDVVQAVPGGRWFLVPSPLLRYTRRFTGGGGDGEGEGGESSSGGGGGKGNGSVGGFNGLTGSRGTDVLTAEFDNLTRRSAISQTSYLGDGFKAGAAVDSLNVRRTRFFFLPEFFFPLPFSPSFSHSPFLFFPFPLSSFCQKNTTTTKQQQQKPPRKTNDETQGLTLLARQKLRKQFLHSVAAQYNSRGGPLLTAKARPAPWASVVATALPRRRLATASAAVSPAWLGGEGRRATLTLDVAAPYGDPRGGGKRVPGLAAAGIKWSF